MIKNQKAYSFGDTLAELDAGIFLDKLSRAMSETAASVIQNSKPGKVTIELSMKQIGETNQVALAHKLRFDRPTLRGKATEEETTHTPVWVGKNGLTLMPDLQENLDFSQHKED